MSKIKHAALVVEDEPLVRFAATDLIEGAGGRQKRFQISFGRPGLAGSAGAIPRGIAVRAAP